MEKQLYEEMARLEGTHWWFVGRRSIIFDVLKRFLSRGVVLDVGIGTGLNAARLIEQGFTVKGIDSSPEALAYAQTKVPGAVLLQGSFPEAVPSGEYDLITMFDVLEHFPDDARVLAAARGVLKRGGLLFLTTPAYPFLWSEHDELAHHVRRYRKKELVDKLRSAGFEPILVSYFNFFLFPLIALTRLYARYAGTKRGKSDFSATPALLNTPLAFLFGAERYILRLATLPWGVSLLAVARAS